MADKRNISFSYGDDNHKKRGKMISTDGMNIRRSIFKAVNSENFENPASPEKETYGLDIAKLKQWSEQRVLSQNSKETAKQEMAVAKVRSFLDGIGKIFFMFFSVV